jgi:hypothetical protein
MEGGGDYQGDDKYAEGGGGIQKRSRHSSQKLHAILSSFASFLRGSEIRLEARDAYVPV